jgi:hypothetical protein
MQPPSLASHLMLLPALSLRFRIVLYLSDFTFSRWSLNIAVVWDVKPETYPEYGGSRLVVDVGNLVVGRLSSRDIWVGVDNGVSTHSPVHIVRLKGTQ